MAKAKLHARHVLQFGAFLLAGALVWLFSPPPNKFRSFDPVVVGRDEANLWRAYYEHRYGDLANGLTLAENRDFGLSPLDSTRSGIAAANAARIFQRSHSREQAQAALPQLTEHFRILSRATHASIDPGKAARLELDWWQKRREVHDTSYASEVAAATAYLYGVPDERVRRYAQLRVAAMALRDRKGHTISEADWGEITRLLIEAYSALRDEVTPPAPSGSR
jgi:hypothetical protein